MDEKEKLAQSPMSHTPGLPARVCTVSNAFTPYTENPETSLSSSPKRISPSISYFQLVMRMLRWENRI